MLHGSGGVGMSLVEKWKDLARKEGFIIAGPDSSDPRGWNAPKDGPAFLRDLVAELKAKYPLNSRRVELFGHSDGASFAHAMALVESKDFAPSAIHAVALPPDNTAVITLAFVTTP